MTKENFDINKNIDMAVKKEHGERVFRGSIYTPSFNNCTVYSPIFKKTTDKGLLVAISTVDIKDFKDYKPFVEVYGFTYDGKSKLLERFSNKKYRLFQIREYILKNAEQFLDRIQEKEQLMGING